MNPDIPGRTRAFTLVELLTVIAIIAMLSALLLPVLNMGELRGKRIVCVNNLSQVGLAFHAFSNDHSGKFPMALSTNDGGSLEYVESGFQSGPTFYTAFYHFQALSNELVFPRILTCPMDMARSAASNFPSLQNRNLSYFAGVSSTFDKPESILAGDRNLATNSWFQPTILQIGLNSRLWWTWEMHQHKGNMLFADGHAEQWNDSSFGNSADGSSENQSLFLPSVEPNNGPATVMSGGAPAYSSSSRMQPEPGTSPVSQPNQPSVSYNQSAETRAAVPEPEPPSAIAATPSADSKAQPAVASSGDSDSGMSDFDQKLNKTLRHDMAWGYFWLWLLLLLYLAYRLWKWYRKRDAKLRAEMARRIHK